MESSSKARDRESGFFKKFISNRKERTVVMISLIIALTIFSIGIFFVTTSYQQWLSEDSRAYKGSFKQLGSIARIGFFGALSIFPVFLLLKWKGIKKIDWFKGIIQLLAKLVRQWHVPIALLSVTFALLHSYMAILKEFELDFTYLSGISSLLVMLPLMFMGLKRYKRSDKKWHLKLAIGFLVLFMLHATFAG